MSSWTLMLLSLTVLCCLLFFTLTLATDDSDSATVSVLVYLDNVQDTPGNREVVGWAAPLIESNQLVEFVTSSSTEDIHQSVATSGLAGAIIRTNSALRSTPPMNTSPERNGNFTRYVNKFDIVLALACSGVPSQSQRQRLCWERISDLLSPLDGASGADVLAKDTGSPSMSGPRTILYLPEWSEQQLCGSSGGNQGGGSDDGMVAMMVAGRLNMNMLMVRPHIFIPPHASTLNYDWKSSP